MNKGLLLMLIGLLSGCCKEDIANNTRACVRKKICAAKEDSKIDWVSEYIFNGKVAYAFSTSTLGGIKQDIYDSECNFLCSTYSSSTFTIKNYCDGTWFDSSSVFVRNVWGK